MECETPTKRVLLVDPCAFSRLAMGSLLQTQGDLNVVQCVGDLPSARHFCAKHSPDLIVTDVELQRGSGIELLRERSKLCPAGKVLLVTHNSDPSVLERALRAGVRALVSKADPPDQLLTAVRSVLANELFASPTFVKLMLLLVARGELTRSTDAVDRLSDREFQVFSALGRGLGAKAVAAELGLSVRTVECHQMRIKKKLRIKTCGEIKSISSRARIRAQTSACVSASFTPSPIMPT